MKQRTSGNPSNPPRDSQDAAASRERVRREILRTNTAVGVVLIIVLALTLGVALTGTRATRNQQRAELAEAAGLERLWDSYLAQARAVRVTAAAGRREQALGVISNAAAIRPALEIRSEAVASLALTDLEQDGPLIPLPGAGDLAELDPQLEHFAYGDGPGVLGVSRLRDGARLFRLEATNAGPGTRMVVRSAAFSPDGRHVAARFDGGALVVWNMATRKHVFIAGADSTDQIIAGMTYSGDSKRLMFSDPDREKLITIVDLDNSQRLVTGIRTGARPFRFRPGRETEVVVGQEGRLDLMEYPSGTILRSFEHPTRIFLSAWSPNGALLAVACEDGDVYLWDAERGTHRLLRGHSEPCIRLGFSPDGKLLFTGSRDGTTRLWAVESGQVVVTTKNSVAHTFSPDGKRIGFWQMSKAVGTWKVDTSDCFLALQCPKENGAFVSLDLSADGRWCLATQTKGFRVWDLATENHETWLPLAGVQSARVAPDGKSFYICRASGLEQWFLTDAAGQGGDLAFKSTNMISLPDQRGARNVAVSTDGTTAAVELSDHRLAVLDLQGSREPVVLAERWRGENLKSSATPTGPGRFAISPDGRWVCTGYWLGSVDRPRVWNARTGEMVAAPKAGSSLAMFSNDGKWLGLSGVGTFHIYSTADWSHFKSIQRDESSFTHGAMAFLDDGQVALTRTRQSVQLRDARTDEKFLDLIAPVAQSVTSIRVARNGSVLATGSARDTIQVWRLDRVRKHLAGMGMDWGGLAAGTSARIPAQAAIWTNTRNMLVFGLASFLVAAMLSLFALRRHRAAIERFFEAEARATERNQALEAARLELVHSQKMQALGTLAAGIAHDFNNLLSVIRMSNKLIGRATRNDRDLQENVAEIEQAVLQGKSVVASMLGYARAENEPPGPVDLCAVIEDNVSLLSKEFLSGITLTLELDRDVPRVEIGRGQIDQVLLNLIVNASEAMQAKGRLRITLHERAAVQDRNHVLRPAAAARYVELAVADSGPGIPPEIRDRLFEPFFTTKNSGAKAGTGLGLSLVYSVAQQEGLGLSVESEPGQGAAFILLCPVRETHSSQNKKPA